MAAKTAEQKAAEAKAAEEQKAADEQAAAEKAADEQNAAEQKAADDAKAEAEKAAADAEAAQSEAAEDKSRTPDTIPAVEHSAPAVENADAIAEAASPNDVTAEDGVAAFRPPQTQHTPWVLNTLAESEGGSALGVEQISGNADVTKDPADRPDADETE